MADYAALNYFMGLQTTMNSSCTGQVRGKMCYWQHLNTNNGGQLREMLLKSNHVAHFSAVHLMRCPMMHRLYSLKRSEHRMVEAGQ